MPTPSPSDDPKKEALPDAEQAMVRAIAPAALPGALVDSGLRIPQKEVAAAATLNDQLSAIQAWAGNIAVLSLGTASRTEGVTLFGADTDGKGVRTEHQVALAAEISARRWQGAILGRFSPERVAATITLESPRYGEEIGRVGDIVVRSAHKEFATYDQFPIEAQYEPYEIQGMARALTYFRGAILGAFIGSRRDGVLELRDKTTFRSSLLSSTTEMRHLKGEALVNLGLQLVGCGGISDDFESSPHPDYSVKLGFPPGAPQGLVTSFATPIGQIAIRLNHIKFPEKQVELALNLESGTITVASLGAPKVHRALLETVTEPLAMVPFSKGFIAGYRAGFGR